MDVSGEKAGSESGVDALDNAAHLTMARWPPGGQMIPHGARRRTVQYRWGVSERKYCGLDANWSSTLKGVQPTRKPVRNPGNRCRARLPLAPVRKLIWEQAVELATAGDARDVPAVLANRFKIPERTIHLVLIAEGMAHERTAAALRNGMVNALAMAREAGGGIHEELSGSA
jgi:hypothetical protein